MKNFDSGPQLQHFSYVHLCAARSRHGSYSRQCCHLLLQRQLASLLQCGPAGHGFGGLVQQLQDQSPEPLLWTVEGVLTSDRAVTRIELNRLVCGTESNQIKSFFAELPITTFKQCFQASRRQAILVDCRNPEQIHKFAKGRRT